MSISSTGKLDLVSRVTVHVFAAEVLFAALLAASGPKAFAPTFAALLSVLAFVQGLAALGARRRAPTTSLTEWDGIAWLLLAATGALLFLR